MKKRLLAIIMIAVMFVSAMTVVAFAVTRPGKVAIQSASVSGRQVTVKFKKVKNAKSYKLYKVTGKKGKKKYKLIKTAKTNKITFMGSYNKNYRLVVRAYNGKRAGKYSAEKKVSIKSSKTYVFFGSDSRTDGDEWSNLKDPANHGTNGTPRSDVIMLLRINDKKKTVDLVSIYRDTLLDISGKGTDLEKINKAYSDFGPYGAIDRLEKNLNIQIDGYAATNFDGVAKAIDALGGITINIEKDKVVEPYRSQTGLKTVPDVMNRCIDEQNRLYGTKVKHVKKTGKQKLNGTQAVAYARVRYTDGSDMQRSVRQRKVLTAMLNKYKKASPKKQQKVLKAIYPAIDTDLSNKEFKALMKKTSKYSIGQKLGFPFYKSADLLKTKGEGEVWVVTPADLNRNVKELHKKLYGETAYKPNKTVKKYSKAIQKKTKRTYAKRSKNLDNKY